MNQALIDLKIRVELEMLMGQLRVLACSDIETEVKLQRMSKLSEQFREWVDNQYEEVTKTS